MLGICPRVVRRRRFEWSRAWKGANTDRMKSDGARCWACSAVVLAALIAGTAAASGAGGYADGGAVFVAPRFVPHLPTREDARLEVALARLGSSFHGWAGLFVEDLATGAYAGWNEEAAFPAASTVKLGVIAEGIRRFGFGRGSPIEADLRAIGQ